MGDFEQLKYVRDRLLPNFKDSIGVNFPGFNDKFVPKGWKLNFENNFLLNDEIIPEGW